MSSGTTKALIISIISVAMAATVVALAVLNSGPSKVQVKKQPVAAPEIAFKEQPKAKPPTVPEKPKAKPLDIPKLPTWREVASRELSNFREPPPVNEPLPQPELMTKAEYQIAVLRGSVLLEMAKTGRVPPDFYALGAITDDFSDILFPKTLIAISVEIGRQLALRSPEDLERIVNAKPAMRWLLSKDIQNKAAMRPAPTERQDYHRQFAKIVGDIGPWSLVHPFDALTGVEMQQAIAVARKVQSDGLGSITSDHRRLLLRAGASAFFAKQLEP